MAKAKKMTKKKVSKKAAKAKKPMKKATKKVVKKATKKAVGQKMAAAHKSRSVAKSVSKSTPVNKAKIITRPTASLAKVVVVAVVSGLTVGDEIPSVTLPATGNQSVNLRDISGKRTVLFFYPKDMTPGCTIEGHEFTKLKPEFELSNTVVYGVSRDTVESHEKFKEKECYTIDLLSDADETLCNTFGVIKDKNMYGKTVRGIERSTFVVDENGRVVKEWRGVKVEGHAQEVLEFLRSQAE